MYNFYTEDDIRNKISRIEMTRVIVVPIHDGDSDIMVKIGDASYQKMSADEIAALFKKDGKGEISEGGLLIR